MLFRSWDYSFTARAASARRDGTGDSPVVVFEVCASDLTSELQEYYGFQSTGARSPEIPKRAWVTRALNALVEFKLAVRKNEDRYIVNYKRTRGDTLLKFGRLWHALEEKRSADKTEKTMLLPGVDWT